MGKIAEVENDGSGFTHVFFCPGCNSEHGIIVAPGRWEFDGNMENPTISPSVLVRGYLGNENYGTCHSFVKQGKIQFLNDCTHKLKGQTIDLPDEYD